MLHSIRPASGSRRKTKRIARGTSGKGGATGGRGTKGQQSRTGKGRRFGFEGGQVPLIRRQPKLSGFTAVNHKTFEVINLATLEKTLEAGTYTLADLLKKRLVRKGRLVKLLGQGTVSKKFDIQVHAASKAAKAALAASGGTVTLIHV